MSIADKQIFLRELKERLGDFIPGNQIDRILEETSDVLVDFEMISTPTGGDDDSEDLLKYFLDAKRVEGRAESTLERYSYLLQRLRKDTGVPFSRMTVYHIRGYFTSERSRGISASTIEGYRSAYAEFFKWLAREGLIKSDPMVSVSPIKQPTVERLPFSPVELERIEAAAMDPDDHRDIAIINFLTSTGCRVSEMCGADRADVDFQKQQLTVLGKGAKERTVWFDDVAAFYLEKYLKERTDDDPALFLGRAGIRMQPGGVRAMLKRIEEKSGVENVHPHRFRRTRATTLIDKGMVIQDVATILGHRKLDTTMTYVYIDKRNVANNFRKYA